MAIVLRILKIAINSFSHFFSHFILLGMFLWLVFTRGLASDLSVESNSESKSKNKNESERLQLHDTKVAIDIKPAIGWHWYNEIYQQEVKDEEDKESKEAKKDEKNEKKEKNKKR